MSNIKYTVKKDFFSNINSQEPAWVLGWLLSDGCLYDKRLTIGLSRKDEEVLHKIKNCMEYTGPLYRNDKAVGYKVHQSSVLAIWSDRLTADLSLHEFLNRKSLVLKYPKHINWSNMRHFVRGFFEGDGCVTYNKNRNYIKVTFKGTKEFLKELQSNLHDCLGINGSIVKCKITDKNVYDLDISGNIQSINFLNWIYYKHSEKCRLERKYNRAIELVELVKKNRIKELPTEVTFY